MLNSMASQSNKIQPEWVCNIGEQAFHMIYHKNKNTGQKVNDIVVVGDQSMFIINEGTGKLKYSRRYDYSPSCIKVYHNDKGSEIYTGNKRDMTSIRKGEADSPCFSYLMGSFSNYVMVYKDV